MQRFFTRLGLCACLIWSPALLAQDSATEYEDKLKQLRETIAELKREINSVKSNRNALQNKLQTSEEDIAALLKKIDRLKGDLASQKKQLSRLNKERAQLQQKKLSQQKHIGEEINGAYRLGQRGNLRLLLNQQEPDKFSRQLRYYHYILEARQEKLTEFRDTIAQLDNIEPKILAKTEAIGEQQSRLQSQHKELTSRQAERRRTLAALNKTLASKDAQLQNKAADQKRLQKLLDEVSQTLANIKLPGSGVAFKKRKGKLKWPSSGRIRHRFGSPRADGKLKWQGVFIRANDGRPVRAVHHGRVVFSDYLKGHGMLIIVDHGEGYMSLYAHNQTLLKDTGDWVNSNDVIAKVGNTGGLEEPGVYFEIRYKGNPTNPARWCRA
ncbi:murein hydrolase activator EnvC family protein [Pseudoteredinibacter isoporae]|uniref:Septal ring factor EnvC (AmiA/AmiB activator) n=1 Tax=Pseudoteredinibacter isoporae TaxID=570281 RepID=A0A7X0JPE0_9GAMM|nr:peptidoglycan DD-metalloendopeptidase family protein [Pseudoteredinibacter isoporae]MBB6519867.1 septal ring factor EnvC (AmiA/AmiB activator) [Pseudoteredinibacter isoporae]NHO85445.1 peptidoglycan DD-metalloendopeptidase family protein [Pseudoteredinibacter isoporae]NIB26103.1 peptidoglycan DD-metalloendopeptidase family protein [Pseudoteredinibacter isoporae]